MVIAERDLRMLSACLIASGQPRHSHEWAAEALTSVGSRGTLIRGQPRHSHQWALGQPARTTTELILTSFASFATKWRTIPS